MTDKDPPPPKPSRDIIMATFTPFVSVIIWGTRGDRWVAELGTKEQTILSDALQRCVASMEENQS